MATTVVLSIATPPLQVEANLAKPSESLQLKVWIRATRVTACFGDFFAPPSNQQPLVLMVPHYPDGALFQQLITHPQNNSEEGMYVAANLPGVPADIVAANCTTVRRAESQASRGVSPIPGVMAVRCLIPNIPFVILFDYDPQDTSRWGQFFQAACRLLPPGSNYVLRVTPIGMNNTPNQIDPTACASGLLDGIRQLLLHPEAGVRPPAEVQVSTKFAIENSRKAVLQFMRCCYQCPDAKMFTNEVFDAVIASPVAEMRYTISIQGMRVSARFGDFYDVSMDPTSQPQVVLMVPHYPDGVLFKQLINHPQNSSEEGIYVAANLPGVPADIVAANGPAVQRAGSQAARGISPIRGVMAVRCLIPNIPFVILFDYDVQNTSRWGQFFLAACRLLPPGSNYVLRMTPIGMNNTPNQITPEQCAKGLFEGIRFLLQNPGPQVVQRPAEIEVVTRFGLPEPQKAVLEFMRLCHYS